MVLWRSIRPFRINTQKRCPFYYTGLECKSRKSRNTWSNRQIWPWSTEWGRAKANREFCQENANTLSQQHKRRPYMNITRWSTPKSEWIYSLQPKIEELYTVSKRWRSSIQSAKTTPGAVCGSDHEHLIAKFRLKLRKPEKTNRPFRYDINQIP